MTFLGILSQSDASCNTLDSKLRCDWAEVVCSCWNLTGMDFKHKMTWIATQIPEHVFFLLNQANTLQSDIAMENPWTSTICRWRMIFETPMHFHSDLHELKKHHHPVRFHELYPSEMLRRDFPCEGQRKTKGWGRGGENNTLDLGPIYGWAMPSWSLFVESLTYAVYGYKLYCCIWFEHDYSYPLWVSYCCWLCV